MINDYFGIMDTRYGPHLIELSWECKELRYSPWNSDLVDERSRFGVLRANIDTLYGCRIENFYKLPAVKTVEETDDDASN